MDEEHNLASGFFLVTLFLAAEEKVTGLKGFKSKTIRTMARSVLLILKNKEGCVVNALKTIPLPIQSPIKPTPYDTSPKFVQTAALSATLARA
ncbi:hypothetical protein [Paraglaciecola arctica]|uniref:hypothetical protein n=1 Tax=Paraglaciecola arctica TaxID=1128911 RepID=UPI000587BE73|nr:hypothetical protein [Paraglaciecola arctica]